MFVFHRFCHNVFIVFERFLCFIVRFLVCVYKCYYIYVIKRGLFCYNVTTMLLYIFVLFFVHLMMLYYMCILLYRNSLMQISPLALTNFYQSHIFFFQEIESMITMKATFTLINANVRSSSAVLYYYYTFPLLLFRY